MGAESVDHRTESELQEEAGEQEDVCHDDRRKKKV